MALPSPIGRFLLILALALWGLGYGPDVARAQTGHLTQADIDGYVYLLPRLAGAQDQERQAAYLRESGLSRQRAAFVSAKILITQAVATGRLATGHLTDKKVPLQLQPSPEEMKLITINLTSIVKAQETAQRLTRPRGG
ncbi:MAG: hypothetical protein LBP55_08090 [Candidatus Adiutrix sp.]|nr:hypothetical protein [Candidatus Adiutrix sp.]